MAAEKFTNLAETTLAANYTAAGASITVTSAGDFPTTGIFRVRLGNASKTIFRVDSVSGAVFTGGAEDNDANASSGDTAKIVISAGLLERLLQAPESTDLFGPSGLIGVDRWGPIWKVKYPISADFSWVNQGTATIDTQFGYTRLFCPSATTNLRLRVKTAPSTPYQVDCMMQAADLNGSKYGGLCFRESSTAKITVFQFNHTTNNCQVVHFTNPTTFSSNPANQTLRGGLVETLVPLWLRIKDDGTDLKFSASRDGKYYSTESTVGRTSFMAGGPNEIGFFGNVDGSAGDFELDFFNFLVS